MKKCIIAAAIAGLLILGCATGQERRHSKDPVSTGAETVVEETNKLIKDTIRTTGRELRKETKKAIRKK